MIRTIATATCILAAGTMAQAQDVRITTFKSESTFSLNGITFTVTRDQNTNAVLEGEFTRTSRACPPHCLQPISLGSGVETFGELEVMSYLETSVSDGIGLLVDARSPQEFAISAIPGSVNVPFITLAAENRFRPDILRALGAVDVAGGAMDFSGAMDLAVYSGGVWSNDAPMAIQNLIEAGYPAEKIHYYRGGMQAWTHVGLSTISSANPG